MAKAKNTAKRKQRERWNGKHPEGRSAFAKVKRIARLIKLKAKGKPGITLPK